MDLFENLKKMQEQLKDSQDKLKEIRVEGSSGGGLVKIEMDGTFAILSIKIDKSIVNPEEISILEDLIKAATNEAQEKAKEKSQENLTKNIDLSNLKGMFDGGN